MALPLDAEEKGVGLVFRCQTDRCPVCGQRLATTLRCSHSRRDVLTLYGHVRIDLYATGCVNERCTMYKHQFWPVRDLLYSHPGFKIGWCVVGSIIDLVEHHSLSYAGVYRRLDDQGVVLSKGSVPRLYGRFARLSSDDWESGQLALMDTYDALGCVNLLVMAVQVLDSDAKLWLCYEAFGRTLLGLRLIHNPSEADLTEWLGVVRGRFNDIGLFARRGAGLDPVSQAVDRVFGAGFGRGGVVNDSVNVATSIEFEGKVVDVRCGFDVAVWGSGGSGYLDGGADFPTTVSPIVCGDLPRLYGVLDRIRSLRALVRYSARDEYLSDCRGVLVSRLYTGRKV